VRKNTINEICMLMSDYCVASYFFLLRHIARICHEKVLENNVWSIALKAGSAIIEGLFGHKATSFIGLTSFTINLTQTNATPINTKKKNKQIKLNVLKFIILQAIYFHIEFFSDIFSFYWLLFFLLLPFRGFHPYDHVMSSAFFHTFPKYLLFKMPPLSIKKGSYSRQYIFFFS